MGTRPQGEDRGVSNRDDIIRRARKLMRFNETNATREDVANATAILQRMVEKHQLSIADLESEALNEGITVEKIHVGSNFTSWGRALSTAIGHSFDCEVVFSTIRDEHWRRVASFRIIGTESDVQCVVYLYDVLSRLLRKMGIEAAHTLGYYGGDLRGFLNSYIIGASVTIGERLRERREARAAENNDVRALVAVKDKSVERYIERAYPGIKADRAKITSSNRIGYIQGRMDGCGVPLTAGVSQDTSSLALEADRVNAGVGREG